MLAVDESAEVRLLASIAHVERAAVVYVLLRLVVVSIARSGQSLISEYALLLCVDHSFSFDESFLCEQRTKHFSDWFRESFH